ncbi:hypothetical protein C8J57DRAFT_1240020 [Mycena rebaudengoi]|nr:hypothetical protein C8J57DRAFT_1240020 [Mycena rebaudengoi]
MDMVSSERKRKHEKQRVCEAREHVQGPGSRKCKKNKRDRTLQRKKKKKVAHRKKKATNRFPRRLLDLAAEALRPRLPAKPPSSTHNHSSTSAHHARHSSVGESVHGVRVAEFECGLGSPRRRRTASSATRSAYVWSGSMGGCWRRWERQQEVGAAEFRGSRLGGQGLPKTSIGQVRVLIFRLIFRLKGLDAWDEWKSNTHILRYNRNHALSMFSPCLQASLQIIAMGKNAVRLARWSSDGNEIDAYYETTFT